MQSTNQGSTPEENTMEPTSAQPGSEAPLDRAAIERETIRQIFGDKYTDVAAARQGHWELNNYAADLARRVDDRVDPSRADHGRQSAYDAFAKDAPFDPAAFAAAVDERAEQIASKVVRGYVDPVFKTMAARQNMALSDPDFLNEEPKVAKFLADNPALSQRFARMQEAGLADEAHDYVYTKYKQSKAAGPTPTQLGQMSLPNGQAPGSRDGQGSPEDREKRIQEAAAWARRTGDDRPLASEIFADFTMQLPPGVSA